jgi:hypothetical protein
VAFRICNYAPVYADFTAFFDSTSASELSVHPSHGVMEPQGSPNGTQFIISFKPTEYGKAIRGLLVIQTEEVMWSYEVRGSIPAYEPPTVTVSKISTRLPKEVEYQMKMNKLSRGKNYVKSNVQGVGALSRNTSVSKPPLSRQTSVKRSESSRQSPK